MSVSSSASSHSSRRIVGRYEGKEVHAGLGWGDLRGTLNDVSEKPPSTADRFKVSPDDGGLARDRFALVKLGMVYTWLRWDRQKEIDRDLHVMCQRLESYMEKLSGDSSWRMWKSWELKIAEVAGKDRQRSGWCERIRIHLYPVLPPRLFRNTMFPHIRRVNGTERITVQTQVSSLGTFLDSWTMYREGAPLRSFPGKKQATSLEGSAYLWQWAISDTALRYEAANRKQYDFHIEAENFATPLDERIRNARSYTFSDISIRVQIHNAPF